MKNRLILFLIFAGIFSAVFALGAEIEMSEEEAQIFVDGFSELVQDIDAFGIFIHNASLALPMFIPGAGIAWGLFSAVSTGLVFSAIVTVTPELAEIPPLAILYLTPFGIMELAAYSLATSRSFMLIRAIIRKTPLGPQLRPTAIEVGIVVGLLLAGGYIEFYMIESTL